MLPLRSVRRCDASVRRSPPAHALTTGEVRPHQRNNCLRTGRVVILDASMKALAIALDSATCASLQRSLSGHGVDVERRSFDDAAEALEQKRYAAVFLNCTDSPKSRDILAAIEAIPHNRSAVVIGVAEGSASA